MAAYDLQVDQMKEALLAMDRTAARAVLTEAIGKMPPIQFAERVVGPALEQIGQGWEAGRIALSQVYMSGRICEELVETVLPAADPVRKDQPKMAITVLGDHHILGKRIVYSVLRAAGFELLDYGITDVDDLIERVRKDRTRVLLISTLMLPSALRIKQVRAGLNDLEDRVTILVGGAPFIMDAQLWQDVDADGMGRSASEALELVSETIGAVS